MCARGLTGMGPNAGYKKARHLAVMLLLEIVGAAARPIAARGRSYKYPLTDQLSGHTVSVGAALRRDGPHSGPNDLK